MSDSYIALVEKSIDERAQQYQELLRLRAENERLREALKPFADEAAKLSPLCLGPDIDHWLIGKCDLTLGHLRRARAAIEGVTEPQQS